MSTDRNAQAAAITERLTPHGARLTNAIERFDQANNEVIKFTEHYSTALAGLAKGLPDLLGAQIAAMQELHAAATAMQIDEALHPGERLHPADRHRSFLGKKRRR